MITQTDLPQNIGNDVAPIITITTSKADSLRDDGIDIFMKWKRAVEGDTSTSKVLHFEGIGNHEISFLFDTKEQERAWKDAFWR